MPTNWLLWFLKYGFCLELAVSRYNLVNIIESLFAEWRSYRAPESSFWMSVFIVSSLLSIWPPHSFGKTIRFASSILIFMPLGQTLFCFLLDYSKVFWILDVSTPVLPAFKVAFLNPCLYRYVTLLFRKLWCMWHQMEKFLSAVIWPHSTWFKLLGYTLLIPSSVH